jgi:hypothetical protein
MVKDIKVTPITKRMLVSRRRTIKGVKPVPDRRRFFKLFLPRTGSISIYFKLNKLII